jgi:acetoin utilization protein AcuB
MRIKDVMTKDVVTVDEKTSIHDARKILSDNKIRRLPVVREDKLIGLVTERMLLEASPSQATTLSIYELQYILAKMRVSEIMVKKPVTISSSMPVEEALKLGREKGYGGFPVVDNDKLVGMITESDIVNIMGKLIGVFETGVRIDIDTDKRFGNLQSIMKILDEKKIPLLSLMLLSDSDSGSGYCHIFLRLKIDRGDEIAEELKSAGFNVTDAG